MLPTALSMRGAASKRAGIAMISALIDAEDEV
jgi:hypothetical protein